MYSCSQCLPPSPKICNLFLDPHFDKIFFLVSKTRQRTNEKKWDSRDQAREKQSRVIWAEKEMLMKVCCGLFVKLCFFLGIMKEKKK